MYPLNSYWAPEVLENTPFSFISTPPLGKPDPYTPRPLDGKMRLRVFQKAQQGPTCMYYAARRLSPHIGRCSHPFAPDRANEKSLSMFKRVIASTEAFYELNCDSELKVKMTAAFLSQAGFSFCFPVQSLFLKCLLFCDKISSPLPVPSLYGNPMFLQAIDIHNRQFTLHSIKSMLLRMELKPLSWNPGVHPAVLVAVLRKHLYFFCIGVFGKHKFQNLIPIELHPKLGHIWGGYLKEQRVSSEFFSLHAIVVIGVRVRSFLEGEVYFIDPVDPSGPGLAQPTYRMPLREFTARIRGVCGYLTGPHHPQEMIWVGNPARFLP